MAPGFFVRCVSSVFGAMASSRAGETAGISPFVAGAVRDRALAGTRSRTRRCGRSDLPVPALVISLAVDLLVPRPDRRRRDHHRTGAPGKGRPARPGLAQLDLPGAMAVTGLAALVFGIQSAASDGWTSPKTHGVPAVSGLLLTAGGVFWLSTAPVDARSLRTCCPDCFCSVWASALS